MEPVPRDHEFVTVGGGLAGGGDLDTLPETPLEKKQILKIVYAVRVMK